MSAELSGEQRLDLYVRALVAFEESKRIPDFFKSIFKGSILPHRDSMVLHLFLKEIDGFTYTDNSENLGNAFEYLLSIMGSQGDAGQFRTPRHIIDFAVEVVDPKKGERILDPACGTAGFLISSYKHIRKQNSSNYDPKTDIPTFAQTDSKEINDLEIQSNGKYKGDKLTPDDRKKMAKNIHGYDVAPEMVRLSKVNMYLHGFKTPQIYPYNTLAEVSKWDEYFDVIFANPPFMTPKGGIQTHRRFQVQANRSEVLFVDYIAEHLNIKGRAGIIVPEGIIFQSASAYKDLRKNLVENWGLWAVISLPAGIFNPYSGVKTSILFLDKVITKKTDKVLFVKIENDGFDLGAQRRKIDKNDLSEAFEILEKWKDKQKIGKTKIAHVVKKSKIKDSGDYNLTGHRYREEIDYSNVKWEMVKLGDIITTITPPNKIKKENFSKYGNFPIIDQSQKKIAGWTDDLVSLVQEKKPLVIFGDHTCIVKYIERPFAQGADGIKILKTSEKLLPKFLFFLLKVKPIESDGYQRHFTKLKRYRIPLPSLEVQKQIVAELDDYQKVIDGAKQVVENWKPQIKIDPEWPLIDFEKVSTLEYGSSLPKKREGRRKVPCNGVKWYKWVP